MDLLPQEIVRYIYEFNQDPDQLVILHHGYPTINRNSFCIRQIGAIQCMKKYYRLHSDITSFQNRNLYYHGKNHYINHNHYLKFKL
jgi:hypothetical protein